MLNVNKIKGRMRKLQIVQADVAKRLNIAESTASQKINGKRPMDLEEAMALADMLGIESGEFGVYFFLRELHSATMRKREPPSRAGRSGKVVNESCRSWYAE